MSDLNKSIVVNVKADTSQATRELQKLERQVDTSAQKLTQATFKMGEWLDKGAVGLAKFNLALEGLQKGFQLIDGAIASALDFARLERMEKALPTGAIDKLRDATKGLVVESDLVRIAVKGMTGDFALTTDQMALTLQAAQALESKGFGPAEEIANKLTEALAKGVNRLDDYGIDLEKTKDRQGDVNAAMSKFQELVANQGPMDSNIESLKRGRVAMQEFGEAIAKAQAAAASLALTIGESLGEIAAEMAMAVGLVDGGSGQPGLYEGSDLALMRYHAAGGTRGLKTEVGPGSSRASWSDELAAAEAVMADREAEKARNAKRRNSGSGRRATDAATLDSILFRANPRELSDYEREQFDRVERDMGIAGEFDRLYGGSTDTSGVGNKLLSGESAKEKAKLKALEDYKQALDDLHDSSTAAGAGMSVFAAGVEAATSAAIEGDKGIAAAALGAMSAQLKGLAVMAATKAIFSTAEGFFALAVPGMGNPTAAFTAAAKYAAAATAAGIGSAALGSMSGGGGGASPSAGAGGGFRAPGSERDGGGGMTIVVQVGDGFVGKPKELAAAIDEKIRGAVRSGHVRDGRRMVTFA